MKKQDKYFLSIKQIFPDAIAVIKPTISGMIHAVYIAERPKGKYVCRFSKKAVAEHNFKASKILETYDIKAPRISIHNCGEYYCETYPFISGKTLHERLQEGLTGDKLDNVYRQIFDISHKIENIPYNDLEQISAPLLSSVFRKAVSMLNPSEKRLCHTDLHAKNIILDEKDDVFAILDLDSVFFEYASVAHFIIMKDAKMYGYDINKFNGILKDVDINNLSVKLLSVFAETYIRFLPETLRKQILKVRVK